MLHTPEFFRLFHKILSSEQQRKVRALAENQLTANPFVGDHLKYEFFREKRLDEKRVYFLIYEDLHAVLLIGISDKRQQQDVIDEIIARLDAYKEFTREQIKQIGRAFPQKPPSSSE